MGPINATVRFSGLLFVALILAPLFPEVAPALAAEDGVVFTGGGEPLVVSLTGGAVYRLTGE